MQWSRIIPAFVSLVVLMACKPETLSEVQFSSHDINLYVNLEKSEANISDSGVMTVQKGANLVYLPANTQVQRFIINDKEVDFTVIADDLTAYDDHALASNMDSLEVPFGASALAFRANSTQKVDFLLEYTGVFDVDVKDVRFSNQNVGREVTATILEKGAYFSPSSFYYPRGNDELMEFSITANIPAHWESIADGNNLASTQEGDRKIQTWANPYGSDGLMFMAAPFVVKHARAGDVDVYCYFFEEDTSLFETYLPATVGYMRQYEQMIGPYPYERFTVAENFFPTGYGMPAWTLLGQQVIRLPFIVMTSLGHEVLHNWWGNSIYVDYEKGNWCEGLTVYGADYHYKLKRSPAGARDYRKDILKQYQNYVNEENEFPVREFRARHNAESRTIGYNKTMMIFHMIEEQIGTEAFFQAWRDVYRHELGQKVSWETWLAAYEASSGEDLSHMIPQWVDRKGAARLTVELLDKRVSKDSSHVRFRVQQDSDALYDLQIPVRFSGAREEMARVGLKAEEAIFEFSYPWEISSFELDPNYNLFRHLYPQEIEATVAAAMGAPEKHFWYEVSEDMDAFQSMANELTESEVSLKKAGTPVNMGPEGSYAIFVINPKELPSYLKDFVSITNNEVLVNGVTYPREGHTFVLASKDEEIAAKVLVVLSSDLGSLERLGQLIPHYGKYSYLAFKGSRNIGKGQWPALESPLRVEL